MQELKPGQIVIAGIGATPFGKMPGWSHMELNVQACANALADAGVDKELVDAVFVKLPTSGANGLMYGQRLSEAMGIKPKIGVGWDQGGAANICEISMAMGAIATGQCNVALVSYADNPRTGSRATYGRPRGDDAAYGMFSTAAGYGFLHQAYAHEAGPGIQQALGEVAVACRAHGAENPKAQLRMPITMDQYMAGPWVVEPLRRDDVCLVSDGGLAVVVMSAEYARKLGVAAPVPILGIGQAQESWDVHLRADLTTTCAKLSAQKAFGMAGLKPQDMDCAQIYDCFTVTVLMTLEDYGYFPKGGALDFVRDGQIRHGGKMPINTAGALLSETGLPGLQLVHEGVRQMRGTANLQVKGAKHCVVSNQGGNMHTHATLVLGN